MGCDASATSAYGPAAPSADSAESELLQRRGKELASVSTTGLNAPSPSQPPSLGCSASRLKPEASPLEKQLYDGLTRAPDGTEIAPGPPARESPGVSDGRLEEVAKIGGDGCGEELQAAIETISEDIFGLPFSASVAIPTIEDTPLIGISDGFCRLTGWSREEIVGRNCRFLLKGVPAEDIRSDVRLEARRFCKAAYLRGLKTMSHAVLLQKNARKCGECFWNLFMLSLVPGPDKRTFVVGLQLDLGPTLDFAEGEDQIQSAMHQWQERLLLVRNLMFGKKPERPLALEGAEAGLQRALDSAALANDVSDWLSKAEGASAAFQQWGTLPFVAWPQPHSRYALLDGGVSILRLEADRVPRGAQAMSIFPVKKKTREVRFKVEVCETCPDWDASGASRLPTGGLTETPPSAMDELGGLPQHLELAAKSVCLRGDGRLFRCDLPEHGTHPGELADGLATVDGVRETSQLMDSPFPCTIQAGDVLEYVWGSNYLSLEVNGEELFRATHGEGECIAGCPPSKKPIFAIFDCCYTVCRATLIE